jgi:hypothetical protein
MTQQGPALCQEYIIENKQNIGVCLMTMPCSREDRHGTDAEIEEWYRAMHERVTKFETEFRSLASMDRGDRY